jgi:hypothetical protein
MTIGSGLQHAALSFELLDEVHATAGCWTAG